MKRMLIFLVAAAMLFITGCSDSKQSGKDTSPTQKTEEKAPEKGAEKAEEASEEKKTDAMEVTDPQTGETVDLDKVIDEFNTTEDPKRKEELRVQLEGILSQFEDSAYVVE